MYERELLAGVLLLSSQTRLLADDLVVWLCDQASTSTFLKGFPPDNPDYRLRRLKLHGQNHTKCTKFGGLQKNSFSQALFFGNRILVQRKYLSYHLCHFVPFFGQLKTKKTIKKLTNIMISVENDVLLAEIGQ